MVKYDRHLGANTFFLVVVNCLHIEARRLGGKTLAGKTI